MIIGITILQETIIMNEFIIWSDELSVGVKQIDEQHKVLVNIINQMHIAIEHHHGSDVVIEILAELTEYTKMHFIVEESLMSILGYPGYEDHKEIHDELLEHVAGLQKKVASGRMAISFELMHFLKSWLSKHIMEEDMQYSGFFLAGGARPPVQQKSWFEQLLTH